MKKSLEEKIRKELLRKGVRKKWIDKKMIFMRDDTKECYSVWVGGIEVNDYYLTKDKAIILADEYNNDGYKTNIRKEI